MKETFWLMKLYPDARLVAGEIVSFDEAIPLPNYSGLVYAELMGRCYILWLDLVDNERQWSVVNAGSTIVKSALDTFFNERMSASN